uniref:Uncharacterized protein n=1 Tax=Ditylenchus dipsaci TaxID=166011 RepID=A0A915DSL1_9BILA
MSSMPLIIQKKSSSMSVDLENKLVEQFKKAIHFSNQDLYTKVANIERGMSQILQAIEKQEKTMQEIVSKLDKHSNQLSKLESEQLKLKSQLQQPRADSEDSNYGGSYQHRGAYVDKDGYRGHTKEYRESNQQNYCSNYDQEYQQNPDHKQRRPQYDSSPRYRPEFEPHQGFENKHCDLSYPSKTKTSFKKFDPNGFGSIEGDIGSGSSEQKYRKNRFQPSFFGKNQQSTRNYDENEHDKKTEFSSLSTKPNKFAFNKGGFGHKAQQSSGFGGQSSMSPISKNINDNWNNEQTPHNNWDNQQTPDNNWDNEQTPDNNWDIYSEKNKENKENDSINFSSLPVASISPLHRPEHESMNTPDASIKSISEDLDLNQSVLDDLIKSEDETGLQNSPSEAAIKKDFD